MAKDAIAHASEIIGRLAESDPLILTKETLLSDLPIDSLDLFTLISEMEDEFGGTVSDQKLDEMSTLGDLVQYFESYSE